MKQIIAKTVYGICKSGGSEHILETLEDVKQYIILLKQIYGSDDFESYGTEKVIGNDGEYEVSHFRIGYSGVWSYYPVNIYTYKEIK